MVNPFRTYFNCSIIIVFVLLCKLFAFRRKVFLRDNRTFFVILHSKQKPEALLWIVGQFLITQRRQLMESGRTLDLHPSQVFLLFYRPDIIDSSCRRRQCVLVSFRSSIVISQMLSQSFLWNRLHGRVNASPLQFRGRSNMAGHPQHIGTLRFHI